jgi:8-oxo-dGTP diphosphatase
LKCFRRASVDKAELVQIMPLKLPSLFGCMKIIALFAVFCVYTLINVKGGHFAVLRDLMIKKTKQTELEWLELDNSSAAVLIIAAFTFAFSLACTGLCGKDDRSKNKDGGEEVRSVVRVGVAAMVVRGGKVLVGKRLSKTHGDCTYQFPGGHLELGESWAECAARETLEETDLDIPAAAFKFVTATNDVFEPNDKGTKGRHYVTVYMRCELADDDTRVAVSAEPDKCEFWKWFGWKDYPSPRFLGTQLLIDTGYNACTDAIDDDAIVTHI